MNKPYEDIQEQAAQATAGPPQARLTAMHWGVYEAVGSGDALSLRAFARDPAPSPIGLSMPDAARGPLRVRRPAVRQSWLAWKEGRQADAARARRGQDPFVEIGWEHALDLVADELARVRQAHGNASIFGGSYGWSSAGRFHHAQSQVHRFLNALGGYVRHADSYSLGAARVLLPHVVAPIDELFTIHTSWGVMARHTRLFVTFGGVPAKNAQVSSGGATEHLVPGGLRRMAEAGVRFVNISPVRDDIDTGGEVEWLPIRPGTDTAMLLAMCHVLLAGNLHDPAFLASHCVGFERVAAYLRGETDGVPKTPAWAERITEVPAARIEALARKMAATRTMLNIAWSLQRSHHGEQPFWALVTLAAMLGQIGLPGGGYGLSYHYSSGGSPTHTTPILKAIDDASGQANEGAAWLAQSGAVSIPVSRLVETLLNPGKTMQFNGHEIELPLVKMAYWAGGNPFSHQQDRNEMLRAWRELDTFVVHDVQWTASARHADIVLPATTSYERNDIEQVGDYALSHIVPMKKVVDPVFEARSDFDIFAAISEQLGQGYAFTQGLTEMDWIRNIYEAAKIESRAKGMEMPVFEVFWDSNKPLAFPVTEAQEEFVRHADFREDPLLNALGTASGKFELFSTAIERYGYDDCPPHATWMEPIERLAGPTTQYPLHLAANHPQMRLHSQLCGTVNRESYQIAGREPCWMNPADAEPRGLKDGDVVRVFNDRGQLLAGLKITDEIMPGVIRINEGGWFDPENPRQIGSLCVYGDVNTLTTGIATSKLAQGNCGHTGVADVERFDGPLPPVTVFSQPAS